MSILDMMFDEETAQSGLKDLKENAKGSSLGNVFYQYTRMEFGGTTTVRFLPQSDKKLSGDRMDNFWLPKKVIRIRFANPEQADSEVSLTIPVMQMYVGGKTDDDIILRQVKALYDESAAELKKGHDERAKQIREIASYHWMRGEAIAQGFVVRPGFVEQNIPENPIRVTELKKQIVNVITSKVNDENPDTMLAAWPVHGKHGYNFIINKTKTSDGKFASYITSAFANHSSPLDSQQIEALKTYGLFDLEKFLPTRPTDDEYTLLADIVRQSIAGDRVWNPDWESHFTTIKVFKTNTNGGSTTTAQEAAELREKILSVMSTKTSSTDADAIVAGLTKNTRKHNVETAKPEESLSDDHSNEAAEDVVDEEPAVLVETKKPLKTTEEVGSILARIRNREKTVTAKTE